MSVRVGTLRINLAVDLQAFQKGLGQAERALNKAANQFNAIGSTLTSSVTLPLLAAGAAAAKIGADFDASLSQINGLVGLSRQEIDQFRGSILSLAGETAKAPKELADALFFITSAGLRGETALEALRVSAKASAAGLGDMSTVADAVTSAVNAYGENILSASQATAVLVGTVREGKASAASIAPVLGQLLPLGSKLGVSFDQVGAAMAAMTRLGFDASRSATAIKSIFTTLLKPSSEAQTALSEVGLSAESLRATVKDQGLLAALEMLQQKTAGNEAAMAKLFPSVEGLAGVLSLLGANSASTRSIFQSLAKSGVGDLDKAFAAATNNVNFMKDQALAQLQVVLIKMSGTINAVLVPGIRALTGVLSQISSSLSATSQDTKNLVLVLALAAAALGPAALGFSLFFKTLAGGFGVMKNAVSLLITLGGVITGPMILAAIALGVAAVMIINKWQEISDGTRVIVNYIYETIRDTLVGRVVAALGSMVAWIAEKLAPLGVILWDTTAATFNVVKDEVTGAASKLYTGVGGAFDGIAAKAGAMATQLLATLNMAVPQMNMQTESARAGLAALGNEHDNLSVKAVSLWAQLDASIDAGAKAIGATYTSLRATMSDSGAAMTNTMNQMAAQSAQSMGAVTAAFAKGKMQMHQFVQQMIVEIGKLIAKILLLKALTAVGMGGPFAAGFIGGMFAEGGRPPVGQVSVVGEKGPELFVPDTAGTIIPNNALGGGAGGGEVNVTQNFQVTGLDLDSDESARRILRNLAAQMRQGAVEAVTLARATDDQARLNPRRAA